jgi:hypothetical protein
MDIILQGALDSVEIHSNTNAQWNVGNAVSIQG